MFKKALVALDLSPAERPILDCLPDLKRWGVEEIVLTHVIHVGYGRPDGYGHEEEYEAWLERCAAPARTAGLAASTSVRASSAPAEEILAAAHDLGADLVVMGSRARNMVRDLFLGGFVREVIRKTDLPLLLELVEPTADETQTHSEAVCKNTLGHVLLATDFLKHSAAAEAAAVALADRAARIDCLSVLTEAAREATPALPVMARAALDAVLSRISKAGGRGEALIENGEPAETITRIAEERHCTLIIVGKHGHGRLANRVIGSTAAGLCEKARRPILIVPIRNQPGTRLPGAKPASGASR